MRHRAFLGINHQEYTIGHIKRALHLATKISVARCINNIDLVGLATTIGLWLLVVNTRLLSGDGNTTLVLLVATIHNERLSHLGLVLAEGITLLK